MTANAKPSWMPTDALINKAKFADRYDNQHTKALISRAALDARIETAERLEKYACRCGQMSVAGGEVYESHCEVHAMLMGLRAEREALP